MAGPASASAALVVPTRAGARAPVHRGLAAHRPGGAGRSGLSRLRDAAGAVGGAAGPAGVWLQCPGHRPRAGAGGERHVLLGGGRGLRQAAGRPLDTRRRIGRPLMVANQHVRLVSDWVDVFALVVWRASAPSRWPRWVVLDEDQYRAAHPGAPRGALAFLVLGAVGSSPDERPCVAAVEAVQHLDIPAWSRFLRRLGGVPERVVTDGGVAEKAVRHLWGGADAPALELRRCEWHLVRNLSQALPDAVRRDRTDRLNALIAAAEGSLEARDALRAKLGARAQARSGYRAALAAIATLDPRVRQQAATRAAPGPAPSAHPRRSFTGSMPPSANRAFRLTNKHRTDALLSLLAAGYNGGADEATWADRIRDHRRGRAPHQRRHTDRAAEPSLGPPPATPGLLAGPANLSDPL